MVGGYRMKYIVYVLKSSVAEKSYVGYTNNLDRRICEHNQGRTSFTKKFAPWHIIHTEEFDDIESARKREKYLKSASGRRLVVKKLF